MRLIFSCIAVVLLLSVTAFPGPAYASDDPCFPVQISFFAPLQAVPKETAVCGVRLNLIIGSNKAVWGLDAGTINDAGNLRGIEVGLLLNWLKSRDGTADLRSWGIQAAGLANVDKDIGFTGLQAAGLLNRNIDTMFTGLQAAGLANANTGGTFTGVQVALLGNQNKQSSVTGVQVGLFNHAQRFTGLELGLGNGVTTPEGATGLIVVPLWLVAELLSEGNPGGPPLIADREAHRNTEVNGVQLGLILNLTESLRGVQLSPLNYAGTTMHGVQIGLANFGLPDMEGLQVSSMNSAADASGAQLGALNFTKGRTTGVQAGFVNITRDMRGLQIGLINVCATLNGLQIGGLNVVGSRSLSQFPVLPVLNAGF